MTPTLLLQLGIAGIQVGSIYALVALGVVLLYRTSKVLNFAHGELSLLAGFLSFTLVSSLGWGLPISFLLSLVVSGIMAGLFYFVVVRKAKAQDPMGLLILTLGFSLFMNGTLSLIWGVDAKQAPSFVDVTETWSLGGLVISKIAIITAVVGLILMGSLWALVTRSRVGLAMRAVAQNPEVAKALGIPVSTVLVSAWAVAAALGGAAALLLAPTVTLNPNLMIDPLNKGFAAAVLGGITSLPGAVLGGYILGVAEAIVGYISPAFKLTLAFVIIVAVLIVRPEGLLGERETRRA